jgi:hypothetical protein
VDTRSTVERTTKDGGCSEAPNAELMIKGGHCRMMHSKYVQVASVQ